MTMPAPAGPGFPRAPPSVYMTIESMWKYQESIRETGVSRVGEQSRLGGTLRTVGDQFFLAVIRLRKMKYSCGVLREPWGPRGDGSGFPRAPPSAQLTLFFIASQPPRDF